MGSLSALRRLAAKSSTLVPMEQHAQDALAHLGPLACSCIMGFSRFLATPHTKPGSTFCTTAFHCAGEAPQAWMPHFVVSR